MPHFVTRTMIAVPGGRRRIEQLRAGSAVLTRDHGILPVLAVTRRTLSWEELSMRKHQRPVFLAAGSLGENLPEQDMMISPNLRLISAPERTALLDGKRGRLVAAKHLVNNADVHNVGTIGVTYHHLWLGWPALVNANGCWAEAYHPGPSKGFGPTNAQALEFKELKAVAQASQMSQTETSAAGQ